MTCWRRPKKLHADKTYDFARCRATLRARGITPRIARRRQDGARRLGRCRWVVERTFTWLRPSRRLRPRYERRADLHQAFLTLGRCVICARTL